MILFHVAHDVKEKMILRSWQVIRGQKFRSFIESEKLCSKIKLLCQPLEEHDLEVTRGHTSFGEILSSFYNYLNTQAVGIWNFK